MQRSRSALIFLLPTLLAGACGGGGAQTETFARAPQDPVPAPLRRSTRSEYGRTISDLTGAAPSVASQRPPDEETLGFDDIASAYSMSTLHAARYLDAAELGAAALVGNA